jgi:hypothetical protein
LEQHRAGAEHGTGQVSHARAAGAVPADRRGHRGQTGLDELLGQPVGGHAGQHRDLHRRRPLQPGDPGGEAEFGGGGPERFVEAAVVPGGDLAQVGSAEHQVIGGGPQSSGDHQPTHDPTLGQRGGALLGQRQLLPAVDADPIQERARRGGHRVFGEHAGRAQVVTVVG